MSESECRIQSILRVPIKSFQGESISSTDLNELGILGDRPLALVEKQTGKVVSGKHPRLGSRVLEFAARYAVEPTAGQATPAVVATIDGEEISTEDTTAFNRRCSEALGADVELISAGSGPISFEIHYPEVENFVLSNQTIDFPLGLAEGGSFADLTPLHILTTASINQLAQLAPDSQIATGRFRPSILLDSGDAEGFVENTWSGRKATLGAATLEFGELAPRCIMTTRAQSGLPKDPGVLRTLARENSHEVMGIQMPCLGIYASVSSPGKVSLEDSLRFL